MCLYHRMAIPVVVCRTYVTKSDASISEAGRGVVNRGRSTDGGQFSSRNGSADLDEVVLLALDKMSSHRL